MARAIYLCNSCRSEEIFRGKREEKFYGLNGLFDIAVFVVSKYALK